jgi:hypothetical protein
MTDLKGQPAEALIDLFIEISMQMARAQERFDSTTYNRHFDRMIKVEKELRSRGTDARLALAPLLDYRRPKYRNDPGSAQVRLNAAKELFALLPERARATLEELAASGPEDQKFGARMTFYYLENGTFQRS